MYALASTTVATAAAGTMRPHAPPTATLARALLALLVLAAPAAIAEPSVKPLRVDRTAPQLLGLRAYTLSPPKYAGDRRLLVTISPNGDRVRDMAKIGFTLTERATVHLRIARTLSRPGDGLRGDDDVRAGPSRLQLASAADDRAAHVPDASRRHRRGRQPAHVRRDATPRPGRRPTTPVIRVLGVEAGFTRESYVPGETAHAPGRERRKARCPLQVFRAGPEDVPDLQRHAHERRAGDANPSTSAGRASIGPGTIPVPLGAWPSGVYFAKLTADDGRIGFAPFVLRPAPARARRASP